MSPRSPGAQRHQVRIIGGQWRRSLLPVADKPGLRPTPDRVRETLFNWLGQDLSGWRVLDAFAGSGALGFEAASRGAAEVLLMEQDGDLVRSLNASRERLKASSVRVQRGDGLAHLRASPARYDLVLLDPPFGAGLGPTALVAAARAVVAGGWVYLEAGEPLPDTAAPGLLRYREGRAGAVHFTLFRADDEAASAPSYTGRPD
ncbi:16S rRNA (guanine(966)-N(2))-methyltransferase RsmD [Ideonella sp. DXS29W]|uniref:16S rRNA (Guanine(966)-N(2))-methyltransferase RsmD n=1 Tax=Ideonella lacteola TaxID=2984193 RepID=A0ABU9BNY3_9BURK